MISLVETVGLPVAIEAERLLLGQILLDDAAFASMAEIVSEADFSLEKHRHIWRAMDSLHRAGAAIDRVTLYQELAESKDLEAVGGLTAIVTLDEGMPQLPHPESYAAIVAEKAERRRAIVALDGAMTQLLTGDPMAGTLSGLSRLLGNLEQCRDTDGPIRAGDALAAIGIDALIKPIANSPDAIPLPWNSVRETIPAIQPGQLVILAARPGIGKTAAGVQIGVHAASYGHGVLMFSLEMGVEEILTRMLAERGQVNMHKLSCGWKANPQEMGALHAASAEIDGMEFYLDKKLARTAGAISRQVRSHIRKHPTRLVILDYLQLAGSDSVKANRNEQISELTRGLKLLAKEMGVAILALSQLSRDPAKGDRAPVLSDLRDSGAIEQDADVVAFLHPKGGARDTDQPVCDVDFIVAKQRKGPLRTCPLSFLRNYTKFIDGGKA